MKNRDFFEEYTRYKKHYTQDNDAWVPFKVVTIAPHTVPVAIRHPIIFSWISFMSEIFSLPKVILVLGKARSHMVPNLGYRGAESPRWFDVSPEKLYTRHGVWAGVSSRWSCQSPVAHSCGLLNHWNSFHRGMFKLNTKFDADPLLYSLNHFECDIHTVHMLTQLHLPPPLTSTVKSSLFTHVHSGPLSLAASLHRCPANHSRYVNNGWTLSRQISCTSTHCTVWTFIGF